MVDGQMSTRRRRSSPRRRLHHTADLWLTFAERRAISHPERI
jgi:hypothetical protein